MSMNYKKGNVYLVQLDNRNSHVQTGIRPCIVVQNNLGNIFSPNLIIVPITTKLKRKDMPVHVKINDYQMALCECILTISKKQILSYLKTLDARTMKLIDRALSISLEIKKEEQV